MVSSLPFEEVFDEPKPQCCSLGACCKVASPSQPFFTLWEKAAQGEPFSRGFLSIFEAYPSHEAASQVVPGLVERTLKAALKNPAFESEADIVFYHCRYLQADNRCGVYEDRPQFCRDYPDTPFVVMAPRCAYEGWGKACKTKYHALRQHLADTKEQQSAVAQQLKALEGGPSVALSELEANLDEQSRAEWHTANWEWILSLSNLYIGSPAASFWF
jgi:Fe-S-cluster containining protein